MRRTDLDDALLDRGTVSRTKKPPIFKFPPGMTEIDYLEAVARGEIEPNPQQFQAVKAAAAYKFSKADRGGKKEAAQRDAEAVQQQATFGRRGLGMPAPVRLKLVVNA